MGQSNGMNQVPTSAANQQSSTPGASPSPNYGGAGVYQPAQLNAANQANAASSQYSAGQYALNAANQAATGFMPPTSGGAVTGSIPPPAQPPAQPPANPFSDPAQQPQQAQPTGRFGPNPFSQQQTPAAPVAPTAPAAQPGAAPNPFTQITVPGATGDFTNATNQPGVFTNAQGFTSPEMAANAANAVKLLDIAKTYGYRSNGQPAMNQFAAGLLSPYTQYTKEKYAR